jgi:uncharacterized protein YrzB (UPF0473 family)
MRTDKMLTDFKITKEDPARFTLQGLINRKNMKIPEVADAIKDLLFLLHTTSTPERPVMNGSATKFVADQLHVHEWAITQYFAIGKCSPTIKRALTDNNIGLVEAYNMTKTKGNTDEETDTLQTEIINHSEKKMRIQHKKAVAQMVLRIIHSAKSIKSEIPEDHFFVIDEINDTLTDIVPGMDKLEFLKNQIYYSDILVRSAISEKNDIEVSQIRNKQKEIGAKISLIESSISENERFIHPLLLVRKDLINAIKINGE